MRDVGVRRRRNRHRAMIDVYKRERGCALCGESDPVCLDFHHDDPSGKIASVAKLVRDNRGWSAIFAEIEKCSLLCANCHRKVEHCSRGLSPRQIGLW